MNVEKDLKGEVTLDMEPFPLVDNLKNQFAGKGSENYSMTDSLISL